MAEKRCLYKCGDWNCGSYQFNLYKDAIDQGELCDVHYWQTKAQRPWVGLTEEEIDHQAKKDGNGAYFALGALWATAKLKDRNK
jgi:hypothetical protein